MTSLDCGGGSGSFCSSIRRGPSQTTAFIWFSLCSIDWLACQPVGFYSLRQRGTLPFIVVHRCFWLRRSEKQRCTTSRIGVVSSMVDGQTQPHPLSPNSRLPVQRHAQEFIPAVEQAIVHGCGLVGVDIVRDQIVELDFAALDPVYQQPHRPLAYEWEVLAWRRANRRPVRADQGD